MSFANATVLARKQKRGESRFEHTSPSHRDWVIVSALCLQNSVIAGQYMRSWHSTMPTPLVRSDRLP